MFYYEDLMKLLVGIIIQIIIALPLEAIISHFWVRPVVILSVASQNKLIDKGWLLGGQPLSWNRAYKA